MLTMSTTAPQAIPDSFANAQRARSAKQRQQPGWAESKCFAKAKQHDLPYQLDPIGLCVCYLVCFKRIIHVGTDGAYIFFQGPPWCERMWVIISLRSLRKKKKCKWDAYHWWHLDQRQDKSWLMSCQCANPVGSFQMIQASTQALAKSEYGVAGEWEVRVQFTSTHCSWS